MPDIVIAGEQGSSKTTGKPLHYKGAPFHRIVKNFMIQGGDFTKGNTENSPWEILPFHSIFVGKLTSIYMFRTCLYNYTK